MTMNTVLKMITIVSTPWSIVFKKLVVAHLVRVTLQLVGSPSWRQAPLRTQDQMLICCQAVMGLVVMGHPPWREDGSVCQMSLSAR